MAKTCRYLSSDGFCGYWDEQLHDRETIRCEGPGGWSDDCYVEDSYGCIYEGEWMTLTDFWAKIIAGPLPDDLEFDVRFLGPGDAEVKDDS